MLAKSAYFPAWRWFWLRPEQITRLLKLGAMTFAALYLLNAVEVAAGYAKAGRMADLGLGEQIAGAVWAGATWPLVLHDMVMAI